MSDICPVHNIFGAVLTLFLPPALNIINILNILKDALDILPEGKNMGAYLLPFPLNSSGLKSAKLIRPKLFGAV